MEVHRSAAGVTVRAPAKLNLFFEVLAKRSDGFHEIETLMAPIGLEDRLHFAPTTNGELHLTCRWADDVVRHDRAVATEAQQSALVFQQSASSGDLPPAESNLAWRTLDLLRRRANVAAGVEVELIKRIPAAAGLGGGSSDAAAALLAGNIGWELHWPIERLAALAAELGSDVPFFLYGGPAICRGRGEQIETIGRLPALWFVVVRPPAGLSTAEVYRRCRPGPIDTQYSSQRLAEALRHGNLRTARTLFANRLEEPASQLSPWPAAGRGICQDGLRGGPDERQRQ